MLCDALSHNLPDAQQALHVKVMIQKGNTPTVVSQRFHIERV